MHDSEWIIRVISNSANRHREIEDPYRFNNVFKNLDKIYIARALVLIENV